MHRPTYYNLKINDNLVKVRSDHNIEGDRVPYVQRYDAEREYWYDIYLSTSNNTNRAIFAYIYPMTMRMPSGYSVEELI